MLLEKSSVLAGEFKAVYPGVEVSFEQSCSKVKLSSFREISCRDIYYQAFKGYEITLKGTLSLQSLIMFTHMDKLTLFVKDITCSTGYVCTNCFVTNDDFKYISNNPFLMSYTVILFTRECFQTEDEYNMSKALM